MCNKAPRLKAKISERLARLIRLRRLGAPRVVLRWEQQMLWEHRQGRLYMKMEKNR